MRKKKGTYSISVVADMLGVHQQTIRLYEKEGLISPGRSVGGTRQFTEDDVVQLEKVIHLTHKLGVNIAGVSMILKLKKKIKFLQEEMNKVFDQTSNSLEQDSLQLKEEARSAAKGLVDIKKSSKVIDAKEAENSEKDDWDIEYDE